MRIKTVEANIGEYMHQRFCSMQFPVRGVTENPHCIKTPETLPTTQYSEGFPSKVSFFIEDMKSANICISRQSREELGPRKYLCSNSNE